MSRVAVLIRISCGIIGGLLCGQCVSRSDTSIAAADSPPIASQPQYHVTNRQSNGPTRPRIATDVVPIPTFAPATANNEQVSFASDSSLFALENEIEQASVEMRQLDRLELPERGEVAWRLHSRLCEIGDRLLEYERSPSVIPADIEINLAVRHNDLTDNRDLIRSLLAAIAIAPEKSAFMAKASRERIASEGTSKTNQFIVVGDLQRIKESDRAWFFHLNDPFKTSKQHMVRVDRTRLTQRIPIGSRVVALGKTVPHDVETTDTPIIATEVYAVRQTAAD